MRWFKFFLLTKNHQPRLMDNLTRMTSIPMHGIGRINVVILYVDGCNKS